MKLALLMYSAACGCLPLMTHCGPPGVQESAAEMLCERKNIAASIKVKGQALLCQQDST